jgi:hypothetical protein
MQWVCSGTLQVAEVALLQRRLASKVRSLEFGVSLHNDLATKLAAERSKTKDLREEAKKKEEELEELRAKLRKKTFLLKKWEVVDGS